MNAHHIHDAKLGAWNRSSSLMGMTLSLFLLATTGVAGADIGDQLDRVLDRTTQARDRAKEAKDRVAEIGDKVQDGVQHLTGEVRNAISETAQRVRDLLAEQFEGRDVFVSERCEEFRGQLVMFLTDLQSLQEAVETLTRPCDRAGESRTGLSSLISMIERAPAGVLYPVWKGIDVDSCLIDYLHESVEALRMIHTIVGGLDGMVGLDVDVSSIVRDTNPMNMDAEIFAARYDASRLYLENYSELSMASGRIQKLSLTLKLIGSRLDAKGETDIKGTLGVHGYALVEVSANPRKSMGEEIKSVADVLDKIVSFINGKLDASKDVSALNLIMTNQAIIIRNQEAILNGQS